MKRTLYRCLALVLLSMPAWAWAQQCTTTIPGNQPITLRIWGYKPTSFDPSVPDGTRLYSASVSLVGTAGTLRCAAGIGVMSDVGIGVVGGLSAYPTSIPGIGLRFRFSGSNPLTGYWPQTYSYSTTSLLIEGGDVVQIEIVKIGPITKGGTLSGEVGAFFARNGAFKAVSLQLASDMVLVPRVPTCAAEQPEPVSLGNIPASRFSGIGSTSDEMPFSIALKCAGGAEGTVTNAFMTLTDQTTPGNRSNTLSLTTGSTAKGIGIRIKHGSDIISYGPDSSAAGTQNQWKALSSISNGTYAIPLTGSYIQVDSKVTGGSANGRATFTMSYQ